MDVLIEIAKAILLLAGIALVLIAIPILWMLIFEIATSIDRRMDR
jgi:hypothetical protein